MNAITNAAMFIIIMWPAFFALVNPVTRKAKPTCMKSTRKPVRRSQVKLMEILRWPTSLASWFSPTWETGTSVVPAGTPVAVT